MTEETLANKMIKVYYTKRFRESYTARECNTGGTNITSLPKLIHLDIKKLPITKKFGILEITDFNTTTQLKALRKTTGNREKWSIVVDTMVRNAERLWIRREVKRLTKKETAPNVNNDGDGDDDEDPLVDLTEEPAHYVTADIMIGLRDQLLKNL